jgi:outer membrane protein OmpA-like peptidoglycan-associated protein
MQRNAVVASLIAIVLLATAAAFAGDTTKVKGMITNRNGDTMTVKSGESTTTVVITDDTNTKDNVDLFGLGRKPVSQAALIPGLKVDVDGTPDDKGRIVAKTITVDGDDLETAEMVQSGLHPTAEQVAANIQAIETNRQGVAANKVELAAQKEYIANNQQNIATNKAQIDQNIKDIEENTNRFKQLADYDVKGEATVKFGVGSAVLDKKDKEDLKNVAQSASAMSGGYIVEVMGYADATGGAAMNTQLSEKRADAVITYLVQECGIRPRFIVAPGAMGEYGPAASNETKAGRAENRRVEVKVLVNKGIAGGNS